MSYFCIMMELRRHIEILLLENDCVIVPNLGGFMAHHVEARYDKTDGMLIPPLRTLGFNPQLQMSDHLLTQSYADAYDISYPEAVKRVEHEVGMLKHQLEKEGYVSLPDLGILSINSEGRYEFEPCESGLLTPSLYGFGAIEMPYLSEMRHRVSSRPCTIEMPTLPMGILEPASSSKPSKLATIMSHIDELPREEEKTISIKVSLLRNLAVTAVAAVALLLFARPVVPEQSESQAPETASVLNIPSSSPASTPSTTISMSDNILSSLESVSEQITLSQEEGVVPSSGSFTIVLAYSLPLENAKAFLNEVKRQGARKAVLFTYKSENVISYGSYASNNEAYAAMQELIASGSIGSAWIMQVK